MEPLIGVAAHMSSAGGGDDGRGGSTSLTEISSLVRTTAGACCAGIGRGARAGGGEQR